MSRTTTPLDAHRAGRFVLAVAADNPVEVDALMREMATDPPSFLRFALELSAISIGLAKQHVGPEWRSVLGNALLDLEVEQMDSGH